MLIVLGPIPGASTNPWRPVGVRDMAEQSEQPTEEPTARRWEKAFEEGQLAFSTELIGGLIVMAAMLFFLAGGKWFFDVILHGIRQRLSYFEPMIGHPDSMLAAFRRNVEEVGLVCLGLMLPLAVVAIVAGVLQTRFNLTNQPPTMILFRRPASFLLVVTTWFAITSPDRRSHR